MVILKTQREIDRKALCKIGRQIDRRHAQPCFSRLIVTGTADTRFAPDALIGEFIVGVFGELIDAW